MKTGDFWVGETLPTPDEPDCTGQLNSQEREAEAEEDLGTLALELLASSHHPPDVAFCPTSLDELSAWKERMKSELLEDIVRIEGGAQEIRVCVATLHADPDEFNAAEFAGTWARGEMLSVPTCGQRNLVLSERMPFHGRDAYHIRLREVFRPAALRCALPWAGKVAYIANQCDADGRPRPEYFAAVDLVPNPTCTEGTLHVVLKGPDGATAHVALTTRQSIAELKGDALPPAWEDVSIGMFLAPLKNSATRRNGQSRTKSWRKPRKAKMYASRS